MSSAEIKAPRVIRVLPYSYSTLTGFEACPRQLHGERLSKEFARPYNKASETGDSIHKQAELYALHGTDFDNPYKKQIIEIIAELKARGGKFYAEAELAVDINRNPVGWWDDNAHARGKLDLLWVSEDETEAAIIDWKTGKPDPFSTQLKHNAMLVFAKYPNVTLVHTRYEWLAKGYATKGKVFREFYEQDWANFEKRLGPYVRAKDKGIWPAKPNFRCNKYCGVNTCEHYGKIFR